jgi:hypothetical protein
MHHMALIDCYLRAPALRAADILAVPPLLQQAFTAVLHSELANSTTAAAGLASALTSLVKRATTLITEAVALQAQSSESKAAAAKQQDREAAPAACLPAAGAYLVRAPLKGLGRSLHEAVKTPLVGAGSGSVSSQAAASIALLAVVLARSLVQLVDAMEAAGPQVLFCSLQRSPSYVVMGQALSDGMLVVMERALPLWGDAARHTAEAQWQYWHVVQAVFPLLSCLRCLGMLRTATPAAELEKLEEGAADLPANAGAVASLPTGCCQSTAGLAAKQGGSAAVGGSITSSSGTGSSSSDGGGGAGSSSSSSRSSSSGGSSSGSASEVKWGYLLHLQQYSSGWAAAVAAFNEKWPSFEELTTAVEKELLSSKRHAQLYFDVVTLCRALADAAPVTVVCNNPSCESLTNVSEAAASCKACSCCRCRYCSVACQAADWERHKHACHQLTAAGYACMS